MTHPTERPLRIFISYSHDSDEHIQQVIALANKLLDDGFDCRYDQQVTSPTEGLARWMERQIAEADFVLLVCTETYLRRVEMREEPGIGHGVLWESNLIYNALYGSGTLNTKFVPILIGDSEPDHIPGPLRSAIYYRVDTDQGYDGLYWQLTDQPRDPWRSPAVKPVRPRPR